MNTLRMILVVLYSIFTFASAHSDDSLENDLRTGRRSVFGQNNGHGRPEYPVRTFGEHPGRRRPNYYGTPVGPVHTFVKTDEHAHFKWGVRHHIA